MLHCNDCNNIFDKPQYIWEKNEFWGAVTSDKIEVCPICKSDNIELTDHLPKCECCNDICVGKYIKTDDGNYYCENCYLEYDN